MTDDGLHPWAGGQHGAKGGGSVTVPPLSGDPGIAGAHTTTLGDLRDAGIDPLAAFGSAFALNRVVGQERINQYLNTLAGNPAPPPAPQPPSGPPQTAPQTSLDGSAGSPIDGTTHEFRVPSSAPGGGVDAHDLDSPRDGEPFHAAGSAPRAAAVDAADDGGRAAVKAAQRTLRKAIVDRGLKRGVAEAGVLAARRGAMLGAKVGAATALRLGAMSIPGLGSAIGVVFWLCDTDERKAVNNLISQLFGGEAAPDLNAPPEPPRTYFLPLTHDGNRDDTIVQMDHGMVRTNTAAFNFRPDDVWPTVNPAIETTTDFAAVATKVNALAGRIDAVAKAYQAAYQSAADEPYVAQAWTKAKPGVDALGELRDTVLPAMGRQLMDGATHCNDAYQAFRQINLTNREEINNSTSGMIPFMANHVNAAKMSDSADALKNAVHDMDRTATALAGAADPFTIAAYHGAPTEQASTFDDVVTPNTPPAGQQPSPPPASAPPAGAPGSAGDPTAKDLASMIRSGLPTQPAMGMPTVPSVPGGMPQIPGLGEALRGAQNPAHPGLTDADLKKLLDDRVKDKGGPDGPAKKPGEDGPAAHVPGGPAVTPAGNPTPGPAHPAPGAPGTPGGPPAAANTTEIGGRKWKFDNPKLAALAHNMSGTDGTHKSLRQAASEAGFRLPPPGQDIGTPVPSTDLKPGTAVMGPNNQNALYLGEQGGKDWVVTEQGELKPLDEFPAGNGLHEGLFRLADDGAAAPSPDQAQPVQQAAAQTPTPPAAGPVTTADTNPGVVPQHQPPPGPRVWTPAASPPGN